MILVTFCIIIVSSQELVSLSIFIIFIRIIVFNVQLVLMKNLNSFVKIYSGMKDINQGIIMMVSFERMMDISQSIVRFMFLSSMNSQIICSKVFTILRVEMMKVGFFILFFFVMSFRNTYGILYQKYRMKLDIINRRKDGVFKIFKLNIILNIFLMCLDSFKSLGIQ